MWLESLAPEGYGEVVYHYEEWVGLGIEILGQGGVEVEQYAPLGAEKLGYACDCLHGFSVEIETSAKFTKK